MLQFLLTISDESDHEKITYLYNKYHTYMLRYAIVKFKDMNCHNCVYDAEDVVQNTFVKITRYIDNVDFSKSEACIKDYVFAILSNEIRNLVKANAEFDEIGEEFCEEYDVNNIDRINIIERYNEVVQAIEALDEKYSVTLFLLYCKEMTVDEIASMQGISSKTVYTRAERGRKLLLELLNGGSADD